MTITPKQEADRRGWIGASDVSAIVGENPYKDAFTLWCEKTGKVPAPEVGEAAEWGNILEPVILSCASKALGQPVVKSTGTFRHPFLDCVKANPDGFVVKCERGSPLVEGKSTSIAEGWGEEGTDEVPSHVRIQVTMQMRCTDSVFAHVARLYHRMGHPDFRLYSVAFSKPLADALDEKVGEFWDYHVQRDIPPDVTAMSLSALGKIGRESKLVPVDPDIVAAFVEARRRAKEAEEAADDAKARLIVALQDGDAAEVLGWRVKYTTVRQERLNADELRTRYPQIAAECTKESGYRKLDVRAIKEKK